MAFSQSASEEITSYGNIALSGLSCIKDIHGQKIHLSDLLSILRNEANEQTKNGHRLRFFIKLRGCWAILRQKRVNNADTESCQKESIFQWKINQHFLFFVDL